MTNEQLNKMIAIEAIKIEVEGMKASNAERISNNQSLAYSELEFEIKADELRALVDRPLPF